MRTEQLLTLPAGDKITSMTESDLPLVYKLERESQSDPWSLQHFIDELDNPVAAVSLYWSGNNLAGFLCTWLIAGEMQVQNIATSPSMRRQGVAVRLLEYAIECGRKQGLDSICLEVRVSNQPAIALYERFGFNASGVRSGYYPDGEDAQLMTYHVGADN